MTAIAIERPKLLVPTSPWIPTKFGIEVARDRIVVPSLGFVDKLLRAGLRDRILLMSGSDGLWLSQQIAGQVDGDTSITAVTTWYIALYTSSIDGTMNGATANEAAYTSYARLSLTNNTTIFPAGTTVSTEQNQNQWPGDAVKSFATSTGGSATVTYLAKLTGNAGTSADKCGAWCSVTSTAIASGDTPQLAQNAATQTRD